MGRSSYTSRGRIATPRTRASACSIPFAAYARARISLSPFGITRNDERSWPCTVRYKTVKFYKLQKKFVSNMSAIRYDSKMSDVVLFHVMFMLILTYYKSIDSLSSVETPSRGCIDRRRDGSFRAHIRECVRPPSL